MNKITADVIVTNDGNPLLDHVVIYDDFGEILNIDVRDKHQDAKFIKGVLVPGYINAHCHLELSHLKGVIPTGTGLVPFIRSVLGLRDFPQNLIEEAIEKADSDMWDAGIVAVGDISNKGDTVGVKLASNMKYHTFVEMFDLFQSQMTAQTIADNQGVYEAHSDADGHKKSYVPHAPYSVSDKIYDFIREANAKGATVSIHNQELAAENEFFHYKSGEMVAFYDSIGLSLDAFKPTGTNSILHTIRHMDPAQRSLFVHNTMTSEIDLRLAQAWSPHTYWATCPNANLYIENRLPDYAMFLKGDAKMCIGTDSLTSNWQLSVFEEMKTIKKYQSVVPDMDIIKWATINGAEALGFDGLGKITEGTTPGLNLIDVDVVDGVFNLSEARSSVKLV